MLQARHLQAELAQLKHVVTVIMYLPAVSKSHLKKKKKKKKLGILHINAMLWFARSENKHYRSQPSRAEKIQPTLASRPTTSIAIWSWSWSFLLVKKTLLITGTCIAVSLACRHPLSSPKWPSWTQYCHHWGLSVCARFGDLEFFLTCTTWWFGVHGFCKPVFQPQAILNSVLRPPLLLSLCTTWWFGVHGLCQPI